MVNGNETSDEWEYNLNFEMNLIMFVEALSTCFLS